MPTKKTYTLREAVKILEVHRNTYLYWESKGRIPKAKRNPMSKYRIFTEEDIKKLRKITGH